VRGAISRVARIAAVLAWLALVGLVVLAAWRALQGGGTGAGPSSRTPAGGGKLLFAADAELPVRDEWRGLSCVSPDRVRRVSSPRAQGAYAYEIRVEDGDAPTTEDERCELSQSDGYRLPGTSVPAGRRQFREGDERWIAFQVRVGDDWDADTPLWNNFMQLKNGGAGGPPLKMAIADGRIELGGIDDPARFARNWVELWSVPFTPELRNRWLRFVLHVRFSPDPEEGFVALYGDLDGEGTVPLLRRTPAPTMKQDADEAIASHPRIGIYRDRDVSGPARIWFDGYAVAGGRRAAEAVAFGPTR
jgi:hypothetical protein